MTTAEDILDAMQQQVGPGFTAGPVIEAVRMSRATLDDLSRQIGPPDPRLNLSLEAAQLWGIRILVDPRVPDGLVRLDVSALHGRAGAWGLDPQFIQQPRPRFIQGGSADEAPGLTLTELIGEIDEALK